MKVLLIDDDQDLVTIFSTVLQKAGYDVISASDGTSGLEKAKQDKPDIILLDQVLPDTPGNDILKKLKEEEAVKTIPVAMLSNFGQNELVEEAIQTGAVDYILKYQIDPEELKNKVAAILKESTSQQQTDQKQ